MSVRRCAGFLLWALLLLPFWGAVRADVVLEARLQVLRALDNPKVAGVSLADVRVLDDFYRSRGYAFLWEDRARVEELEDLALGSRGDGLRASDFHLQTIRKLLEGRDPRSLSGESRADAEVLLSDSLLRLIHHYRYGKVDPQALDPKWNHAEGPYSTDLVGDLKRVSGSEGLEVEMRRLSPQPAFYSRLKRGLADYRQIAAGGGWKPIPPGPNLEAGMRSDRVPAVRERLRVTGEYTGPDAQEPRLFDSAVANAVKSFQERHHLAVDGVVGPATLSAMNVRVEERIDQIRVNLERMRWVYDRLPDDYLLVDVAGQQIDLFRDGESKWRSRAIVGRQDRPTPVFRDEIEYLEFNPSWTVPPTILKQDILPNARKNPGYVNKKGLDVITRGGQKVSPYAVNWHVSAGAFPYQLRQPPGGKNALGRVKFMFPNRFSVYLHDTPGRNLFEKPQRLFSSGCVRVENPMELAELVLNNRDRWNQEKFRSIVDSKRTRWIHLEEPLPIILAYWTADAGEDGRVRFREDVYHRDAQVLAALNGDGPLRLVYVGEPAAAQLSADVETEGGAETDGLSARDTGSPPAVEPLPGVKAPSRAGQALGL